MKSNWLIKGNRAQKRIVILAVLLAVVILVPGALAQGGYELTWWTVDGGGIQAGGGYGLASTTGQHEALAWSGGGYTLVGGFWPGGGDTLGEEYTVFLPVVMRNH